MKRILLLGLAHFLFAVSVVHAQQDPQYTQYMYNQNIINPAYAGTSEILTVTTLYRQQWFGVIGAPETFTLSGNGLISENIGVGLSFITDNLGPVNENNIYGDFSYILNVGKTSKLSLGLKAGVTLHDVSDIRALDTTDEVFQQQISNSHLNLGAGAFFYDTNYYLGLSMPNMLKSPHIDEDGLKIGSEVQHFFFTGGYVFDISDDLLLKPNFMVKGALDAPISFDLNTNVLISKRVELGVSYRNTDSFSGLLGFYLTKNVRMGYAYDRIVSDIKVSSNSSHEVFINFDLAFPDKVMRSPRFF